MSDQTAPLALAPDSSRHSDAVPLNKELQRILPNASVRQHDLNLAEQAEANPSPISTIKLWLIDPQGWDKPLSEESARAAVETPPYWSFCWGSGKALAGLILQGYTGDAEGDRVSLDVTGKTVLDFGAGSGVVGIAAALCGAAKVISCDNDPLALTAAQANARLNGVTMEYLENFQSLTAPVDFLFAADVLYDPDNFELLDKFKAVAKTVIIADSRVKNFTAEGFHKFHQMESITEPDLGEHLDVFTVRLYHYC